MKLWLDGCLVDRHDRPDLLENGLHYGTGVFEGIRAYATPRGPAIFRLADHMDRLDQGAAVLGMTLDRPALEDAMGTLLAVNGFSDAYLRPIAYYGNGQLHLDAHRLVARQAVAALPWTSHLGEGAEDKGIRMAVTSLRRNDHRAIPALKLCGGYVNSIVAKLEAHRRGFEEALFVDGEHVCEASAENVFLVKDGRITGVDHPDQLPGITRRTILEMTGATSRRVTLEELLDADEVFLTGTSAEVAPVTQLEGRRYGIGPITRQIQRAYQDAVHGRDATRLSWLTFPEMALAAK